MIVFGAVIIVIFLSENAAESQRETQAEVTGVLEHITERETLQTRLQPSKLKAGELAKLIHRVNEDDEIHEGKLSRVILAQDGHQNGPKPIDLDDMDIRLGDKHPLSHLMPLIHKAQKDKKAQKDNKAQKDKKAQKDNKPEVRVHVIKNPEVLEQYQKDTRKRREQSTSSSGSEESSNDDLSVRKHRDKKALRNGNKENHDKGEEKIGTLRNPKHDNDGGKTDRNKDAHAEAKKDVSWDMIANIPDQTQKNNDSFIKSDKYNDEDGKKKDI